VNHAVEGQPAARADVVTVIEKWQDVPALHRHLAAPHMLQFRENAKGLVASVEIRVLEPV
jgi:quinol monooxygenase YgiN